MIRAIDSTSEETVLQHDGEPIYDEAGFLSDSDVVFCAEWLQMNPEKLGAVCKQVQEIQRIALPGDTLAMACLRAMPHQLYLKTKHWTECRNVALEYAGNRCELCGCEKHLNVHHRYYVFKAYEDASSLVVLCRGCHKTFHLHRRVVPMSSARCE